MDRIRVRVVEFEGPASIVGPSLATLLDSAQIQHAVVEPTKADAAPTLSDAGATPVRLRDSKRRR